MPAFGDALSAEQLEQAVKYLWTFCQNPAWPRGDLNLPRAFFTEKAFPENETVWTTGVTTSGAKAVDERAGLRASHRRPRPVRSEGAVRRGATDRSERRWNRGLGDVEVALRRTLYASYERGSIVAAGGAVVLPTGKEELGLGNGFTVFEPFAMCGQILGANGFLQVHAGYEIAVRPGPGHQRGLRADGARLHPDPGSRRRAARGRR